MQTDGGLVVRLKWDVVDDRGGSWLFGGGGGLWFCSWTSLRVSQVGACSSRGACRELAAALTTSCGSLQRQLPKSTAVTER